MTKLTYSTAEYFPLAQGFDDMLDQCQWLKRPELNRFQQQALTNILLHAYDTTSYYKDHLSSLIDADRQVDFSKWSEIPFLTREGIQNNFSALSSSNCPETHGSIRNVQSSGSTAEPIRILTTSHADIAGIAGNARGLAWAAINYSTNLAQIIPSPDGNAPYPGTKSDEPWAPFWYRSKPKSYVHRLDHLTPHKQQLIWLQDCGRCYLNTMPTNLQQLALIAGENPHLKPDLVAVIAVGELVSEDLRELVRGIFDCEIIETYSCEEVGPVASQCPSSNVLHVHEELFFVEIIDEDTGLPCKSDETGSVVLTSFHNYAMPLIRYKIGDLATVGNACGCHRGLSILKKIQGRQRQVFLLPDGTTRTPGLATSLFTDHLAARKWQVAQVEPDELEIRFVSNLKITSQNKDAFVALANKRFGFEFKYRFRQLQEMPNLPSGKFFEYVREI